MQVETIRKTTPLYYGELGIRDSTVRRGIGGGIRCGRRGVSTGLETIG
jgi:hypothetical protein